MLVPSGDHLAVLTEYQGVRETNESKCSINNACMFMNQCQRAIKTAVKSGRCGVWSMQSNSQ